MSEKLHANDQPGASLIRVGNLAEVLGAIGVFSAELIRDGKVIWKDERMNTVMTLGKNAILDNSLAGSAYSVTGPFMGLISSASFSAINAADTMASHAGWLEAGNAHAPTYSGNRKTAVFSAASGGTKSLSAALSFGITGTGTVKGAFMCYQAGAVNTIDDTNGTLLSAGLFSGGDRAVINGDTLNVSWSLSL